MPVCRVSKGCCACGTCLYECPVRAITLDVKTGARIDETRCTGCGACLENCASEAIVMVEDAESDRKERSHDAP